MKVRIIKTSAGYVPQVLLKDLYWENKGWVWYSIGGLTPDAWTSTDFIKNYCTCLTQWGAKRVLKKWLKSNAKGNKAFEAFEKELENPNVVYEAEVPESGDPKSTAEVTIWKLYLTHK